MNQDAYRDGWRSGRADRLLGRRSDYTWHGIGLDAPGTYSHDYSRGYHAAWRIA